MIAQRLRPGERLVWYDQPTPWRMALRPLAMLALELLLLASLAHNYAATLLRANGGPDWWHTAVASFIIGLLVFTLVKIADCWRTAYGLTNQRAIIATGPATLSLSKEAFSQIKRTGDDALGTLLFDPGQPYLVTEINISGFQHAFFGIRSPAKVEQLIRDTLLGPQTR